MILFPEETVREKLKAFRTKYKKPLLLIFVLWIIFCLVAGGLIWRRIYIYNRADAFFASGDYVSAKAEFEKIGETERMAQCDHAYTLSRLERAEQLMEQGRLELAKAELVLLGDFENAPELLLECEYRMAEKHKNEGRITEALDLAKRLDEHPQATALLEEIQGLIYDEALRLTYDCSIDEAMALYVKIPGYKDADALYKRCLDRQAHMLDGWSEPVNYLDYTGQKVEAGTVYRHRMGLIYVPDDCNAETTAMIFYPGGYDESLANNYMVDYVYGLYGPIPNALMLFCFSNGYYDMESQIAAAHAALEQAAMENNVFIHDVAIIGASNGAYTAAHTAVWLYEKQGISAKHVVTLDAGQHWATSMPSLSGEDCDVMAKTGTKFLLVEGDDVGMNKLAIQTMVAHKMDVTIAHVANYGHYVVIYDAMAQGIFNWAMGASELPVNDNYTYIKLSKDSSYPN